MLICHWKDSCVILRVYCGHVMILRGFVSNPLYVIDSWRYWEDQRVRVGILHVWDCDGIEKGTVLRSVLSVHVSDIGMNVMKGMTIGLIHYDCPHCVAPFIVREWARMASIHPGGLIVGSCPRSATRVLFYYWIDGTHGRWVVQESIAPLCRTGQQSVTYRGKVGSWPRLRIDEPLVDGVTMAVEVTKTVGIEGTRRVCE